MMTTDTAFTASTNPFASRFIDALSFRMACSDVPKLCARLNALGGHAAIIGPHGSGKTTLAEQIHGELAQMGWRVHAYRTTERRPSVEAITNRRYGTKDAVIIDGAGHIGPVLRRRLFRASRDAGRLVVTAHHDCQLPCLYRCETSLPLLDDLLEDLAPETNGALRPHAHALFARYNGNLRDVLRGLYDHCAALA